MSKTHRTKTRNIKRYLLVGAASLLLAGLSFPAHAQHHRSPYSHHGFGHGYGHRYGHGYGHGYGFGAYQSTATGKLEFEVTPKTGADAEVYINGALASRFEHKKSLRLMPGEYQVRVRKQGYASQSRAVYVTEGEDLELDFVLTSAPAVAAAQPLSLDMNPTTTAPMTATSLNEPRAYESTATGKLEFEVTPKTGADAEVYINGALASRFAHEKSLRLMPGEYQVRVRKQGYASQSRPVYVTEGETLELDFALSSAPVGAAQPSSSDMSPTTTAPLTPVSPEAPSGPMFRAMSLSPSGSEFAIASWSTVEHAGSLQIYELAEEEKLPLDKPYRSSRTFQVEHEILAIAWMPDGKSLVALAQSELPEARLPGDTVAGINMLDLRTSEWATVGTANLSGGSREVSFLESLTRTEKTFLLNWIERIQP